jgi:hypothetical protein
MDRMGLAALVLGASLTWAGAAAAQQEVPIPPSPAQQEVPIPPSPAPTAQPDMSKINPTAGPEKKAPDKKKMVKAKKPAKYMADHAHKYRQEVQAANWLEANGYQNFSSLRRAGSRYQATVADPSGPYTVTVNPATGHVDPPSKTADRETRALNYISQQNLGTVTGVRPAVGGGYLAKVKSDGKTFDVFANPDKNTLTRLN